LASTHFKEDTNGHRTYQRSWISASSPSSLKRGFDLLYDLLTGFYSTVMIRSSADQVRDHVTQILHSRRHKTLNEKLLTFIRSNSKSYPLSIPKFSDPDPSYQQSASVLTPNVILAVGRLVSPRHFSHEPFSNLQSSLSTNITIALSSLHPSLNEPSSR
jgi:hypothetical protein